MAPDTSFRMCERCFTDADMQLPLRTPDGGVTFTCSGSHDGTGPHVWTEYPPAPTGARTRRAGGARRVEAGVTADLLEPLRACFHEGDGWLEYGVVEHRLRQVAPEVFARHVAEAGHTMFGPATNTASGRIATALSSLRARGEVHGFIGPSTGRAWRGDTISHWGLDPALPQGEVLSWARSREQLGLPADEWTDADRAGLTSPTQEPGAA